MTVRRAALAGVLLALFTPHFFIRAQQPPIPTPDGPSPAPPRRYTGFLGCRDCHATRSIGDQSSVWASSKHARAWESLGSDRARAIAAELKIGDPRTEPQCLKCHSTGSEVPPDQRERTWQVSEGVTCEACHGPGSDYRARSVMEEPDLARASGLRTPGPEDCAVCHNSDCRAFVSFDFEPFRARITHPRPKRDEPVLPPPWKELDGRSPVCREDFNRVYDAARLQSRPLLVDLHPGIGCPRCEEMAPVLSDPRVVAEMAPYVRVRIRRPTPSVLLDFGLNDCAEVVIAPDGARRKNCYGALTPELFAHVLRRMAFPGPAGGRVRPSESLPADRLAQLRQYLVDLPRSGEGYGRTVVSEFSRTGRAALPVLQEALWDSEPDIAVHALLLMPACHPPPAPGEDRVAETDTLLDLLAFATDPRPDLRSAAVHALGRLGDRRATSFIARYSIHDYDPGTAFLAFRALGALADPTATPRLLDFIRDPRSGFRGLPGPIDAIPVLYAASDPGAIASIRALGDLPRLRPALAALLGERRDRASLPMLLRWFADPDEPFEVRNEVLFSAAKIGDPTAAASLEVGLSDANVEIRAGVCEIWGALRATDQAPRLLRFLENEKHQVPRAYALKALGELCAPGVPGDRPAVSDSDRSAARSACVAGVADRHPLVRNQAIEALRQMGDPVGWLLREALEDRTTSDVEDRKALTVAARTLAEIGDRRAVPGLVETLDGDDLDTSRVVSIALETLTGNRVPPETRLDYDVDRLLLAAVGAEAVQFRRREILRAVELKIDAWRQWWEGAANLWEAGGEDGASVSGALQPAGMEVRLVEALAAGGEDPAAGAHEFSLWAVLTFRDDKGAPIAPAGWVKVGVPDRGPGTDPLPPFLGRGIRRPVVRGHWAPASHADPDWALAAEVGASGSHGHAGSLWLFLGSGIASEASRLPSLRVEFLGPRGSLTADTAPLRY